MASGCVFVVLAVLATATTTRAFRRESVEHNFGAPGMPTAAERLGRPRFGTTVLPLRQAVEKVPLPSERAEEHYPIRDAVEQRPVIGHSTSSISQWWMQRQSDAPPSSSSTHYSSLPLSSDQVSADEQSDVRVGGAQKAVYCFVESWSVYRQAPMSFSAEHIPPTLCTHLVYAFARVDTHTHKMAPVDEEYDIVKGGYRSMVFLKRANPRLKVLLSVAGPFARMTSSASRRRAFIQSAVRLLQEYNFDGLDIHWQLPDSDAYPSPITNETSPHRSSKQYQQQQQGLARLLEEMSAVWESRDWTLAVSVSASRFLAADHYDDVTVQALTAHAHHILLKSYDLHEGRGEGDGDLGGGGSAVHHSPLTAPPQQDPLALFFNVDYAVRYWLKRGVPRQKLIMGIPLYARTYTLADSKHWTPGSAVVSGGAESRFTQQSGMMAYYEVCQQQQQQQQQEQNDKVEAPKDGGWRLFRDSSGAPFMVKGDQWVGYEDPVSIQTKIRYVNQQRLGGAMLWALDLDDFRGVCSDVDETYPLVRAVVDNLDHFQDGPPPLLAIQQPLQPPAPPFPPLHQLHYPGPTATTEWWQKKQPAKATTGGSNSGKQPVEATDVSNLTAAQQAVVVAEKEATGVAPYVLSTPHDGNCQLGDGYDDSAVVGLHATRRQRNGCPVYYRCDHLMKHRYLCPAGRTYQVASGVCLDCSAPDQLGNATRKAELRKKPTSPGVGSSGKRVVCYFTNWAWYRKAEAKFLPEHIPSTLCTDVVYAYASLDPNQLIVKPFDTFADIDNNFFARVVARIRTNNDESAALLAVGGWTDSAGGKYSQMVGDRSARARFVRSAVEIVREHSFDGLQLDWNYPVCWQSNCKKGPAADKPNFAKLVQELREAFDKEKGPRLRLGVAISGYREIVDRAYDLRMLSKHADYISVMSFDYHGAWEHETGHVSPLHGTPGELYPDYNVDSTVKHLVDLGAERGKLVVGIPFYGQSFTLATGDRNGLGEETVDTGNSGEFTRQPGMLAYYEVCYRLAKLGWKAETSDAGPYAYSGDQWVSYDDPSSIKQKTKYIVDEKLGGAMAWTMDLDDFHNRCCSESFPLLKAINRGLGRLHSPPPAGHDCTKPTEPPPQTTPTTTTTTDNGLYTSESTIDVEQSSSTTTSTTTTTTTTRPITWWPPATTPTTSTTTEEEPDTTEEEEPTTTTTSTTTTTTTTTTKPTTKRPKPSRPKPSKKPTKKPTTSTTTPMTSTTTPVTSTTTLMTSTTTPMTSSSSLPPQEPCRAGEYRGDAADCNAYYRCILNEWVHQRCAGQLHWNDRLQLCDWPENAKCTVQPPSHLESSTSGSVTSSSSERPDEWWTQSSSTWWSELTSTTPATTTTTTKRPHKPPKPSKKPKPPKPTTRPPSTVASTTTTSTTAFPFNTDAPPGPEVCVDGTYYPVAGACDKYDLCVNGYLLRQRCPPRLLWNHHINACDWEFNVDCHTRARLALEWTRKASGCSKGQFTPHPTNCNMYLQCQWGAYEIYSCPPGLHWNPKNNICDWPARSTCRGSSAGSSPPNTAGVGGGGGGGSIKPVAMATTTTTTLKPWEWKPDNEWSWTSSTTTPRPMRQKPSKPRRPAKHPLSGHYKVVCYFTNWAWYRTGPAKYLPEDIDTNLCTHILYGFAVLDFEQLIIKAHDSWADFDNKFYDRVVAMKQKGARVLLAIGGWNDSQGDKYSRLVNSASARQRFIQHVVPFLLKYDFDGLDLDWEYPKCWQVNCDKGPASDKESFGLFVKELKTAFRKHDLLLSAAVSPSKTVIDEGYDVRTMAEYLDWISVMTYDYHGQWDKKTGHLAPMYYHPEDDFDYFNANYSINYWLSEGVPRRKLVMGMPLYGQAFTLAKPSEAHGLNAPAPGPGQAGESTRAAGFLAYYEICSRVKDGSWTVVKDAEHRMGPYAYKGDQWISYDDADMIRRKSEYVRKMGLGGGMIWALDLDDFRNTCGGGKHPLLSIIAKTLAAPPQGATTAEPVIEEVTTTTAEPTTVPPASSSTTEPPSSLVPEPSTTTEEPEEVEGTTEEEVEEVEEETTTTSTTTTTTTKRPRPSKPKPPKPKPTPRPPPMVTSTTSKRPPVTTTTETSSVENDHFKVVCYFTNWAWYRQGEGKYLPSDIDPDLCTHIIYGFAVLDSNSLTIKPHDTWADFDNKFYEKVVGIRKRKRGVKVLLAIGGWNDSLGDKYSRLVNSVAARKRFIQHCLEFVQMHNFDGLDLDWEYPKCWQVNCQLGPESDKPAFAKFVRELHEAFAPHGLLLSAAVSPSRTVITAGYDVKALSKYLDWISVMAYDYHGQWDKITGHVAPMYVHPEDDDVTFNTNFTIHYWMRQGADPRKLVLGMPMYGQSFSLADVTENGLNAATYGGGEAGDQTRARGFLAYYEICERTLKKGWEVVRDKGGAIGPYARLRDQWVSFDDQAMIRHKSEYVKKMNLGGAMIWALDLDDFRNLCNCEEYPLLRTINRVLRNYPGPGPRCKLTPGDDDVDGGGEEERPEEEKEEGEGDRTNEVEEEKEEEEEAGCVDGVVAHPGDCRKYYSCWDGARTELDCPHGLHFDSVRRLCEWPDRALCMSSTSSTHQRARANTHTSSSSFSSSSSTFVSRFPWSSIVQGAPVWLTPVN